jgi:hypothetical protein
MSRVPLGSKTYTYNHRSPCIICYHNPLPHPVFRFLVKHRYQMIKWCRWRPDIFDRSDETDCSHFNWRCRKSTGLGSAVNLTHHGHGVCVCERERDKERERERVVRDRGINLLSIFVGKFGFSLFDMVPQQDWEWRHDIYLRRTSGTRGALYFIYDHPFTLTLKHINITITLTLKYLNAYTSREFVVGVKLF